MISPIHGSIQKIFLITSVLLTFLTGWSADILHVHSPSGKKGAKVWMGKQ